MGAALVLRFAAAMVILQPWQTADGVAIQTKSC